MGSPTRKGKTSLAIYCPDCGEKDKKNVLKMTRFFDNRNRGMFYYCSVCDFKEQSVKGFYKKYPHAWI